MSSAKSIIGIEKCGLRNNFKMFLIIIGEPVQDIKKMLVVQKKYRNVLLLKNKNGKTIMFNN